MTIMSNVYAMLAILFDKNETKTLKIAKIQQIIKKMAGAIRHRPRQATCNGAYRPGKICSVSERYTAAPDFE